MKKRNFFKGNMDSRPSFQKTAFYAFLTVSLASLTLALKGKYPINRTSLTLVHPNVCFIQNRQPFAMILGGLRVAGPQIEHFRQNLPIPREEVSEVVNNHPESLSGAVAAHAVLRHHHYEIKPLVKSENTTTIEEAKKRGFPFPSFQGDNFLDHQRWLGPSFDFEIVEDVVEKTVTLRPSETVYYAFSTRNRIQRGDSKSDPFLPRNQLGRDILGEETKQLEHRISEAVSVENENLETAEDLKQITNTAVYGLAEMVANGYNKNLLNEYSRSPYFNKALDVVAKDLAVDLGSNATKRISKGESLFKDFPGVFHDTENQKLSVYLEDPRVVDKIGFCIKGLEVADRISQPDYKVTYTGEKSKSHFCSFGQAGVYNKQQSQRTKVKTDLAAINEKYESDSFKEALSPEAIIEKVSDFDEDTSNSKEPLEVLTNIVEEAYEALGEW